MGAFSCPGAERCSSKRLHESGPGYVQNMDSVLAAAAAAAAPLDCAAIRCGSGGSRQSGDHADSPAVVPATDCHKAW